MSGRKQRFWRWVAVFAVGRINRALYDDESTYVVTKTGPSGPRSWAK